MNPEEVKSHRKREGHSNKREYSPGHLLGFCWKIKVPTIISRTLKLALCGTGSRKSKKEEGKNREKKRKTHAARCIPQNSKAISREQRSRIMLSLTDNFSSSSLSWF
jgi:hypothetical protein